ncbi:MAG: hypothetical protein EXR45_06735 [Chloroflexi bacterium]|nr:hypothetical protein [Chloroflexota bacterium]
MIARVVTLLTNRQRRAYGNVESVHGDLTKLVMVPAPLFRPTLVGPARAADIVVNVLLPLVSAWGLLIGNDDLSEAAREACAGHPTLTSNWISREVGCRIGIARRGHPRVRRASVQQGMIDLWEGPCRPLACTECPIGHGAKARGPSPSMV